MRHFYRNTNKANYQGLAFVSVSANQCQGRLLFWIKKVFIETNNVI